jgi:phosphate transport system protein
MAENPRTRHFDTELDELKDRLCEMGSMVASAVHRSILALTETNEDFAHQVLRDESRVDQMEIQIDDLATKLIALNAPVARDLRFLIVAIKINTDLERMGDLAVGITERSLSLMHQPRVDSVFYEELKQVANLVEQMVLGALDSFVSYDEQKARTIISSDDAVDLLRTKISDGIIERMERSPEIISRAIYLIFIARSLERIADHATNIAEDVIFLIRGIDVRHRGVDQQFAPAEAGLQT